MNKNDLIYRHFHKPDQLVLTNPIYRESVNDLIVWLLKNDRVESDITSKLLFEKSMLVDAQIIAKQSLTLAGLEEIEYLLQKFTDIKYEFLSKEGEIVETGQPIINLTGDVKKILAYERIILNILQRLSGVATETSNIIAKIKRNKPFIAATRKAPWGLLDKKAVVLGGGLTHRLDLSDSILVKDNHLTLIPAKDALKKLLEKVNDSLIEIEVDDTNTLLELIELFLRSQTTNTFAVLLDNFSPDEVEKALSQLKSQENIIFEASGGINKENIDQWLEADVDIISLGSLTHSPKAADISLDVLK